MMKVFSGFHFFSVLDYDKPKDPQKFLMRKLYEKYPKISSNPMKHFPGTWKTQVPIFILFFWPDFDERHLSGSPTFYVCTQITGLLVHVNPFCILI